MKDKKILRMAQLSFFIATIVVLQIVAYVVSRFTLLPFSLSFVLLPIILGGMVFGVKEGAILGFFFGIITLVGCITGIDQGGAILFASNPFANVVLCIIKATLAGTASAFIYKSLSKTNINEKAISVISAATAPIVNTGIFLIGMLLVYKNVLYEWAGGSNVITYLFTGIIAINFLFEFISSIVLCPIVLPYLKKYLISE